MSDDVKNSFKRHYLRVERMHDEKDAPSVWKNKKLLICDVDCFLRGNPHAPVKDFVGK